MADDNVRAMLGSIEATFDASIARSEDEAASDLAFSLLQDLDLDEAIRRAGPIEICLAGRPPAPVAEIGADYAAHRGMSTVIVPLERGVFRGSPKGSAPARAERSFLEWLRRLARAGTAVEIHARGDVYAGRLARAGRDHVVVVAPAVDVAGDVVEPTTQVYVPLAAVDEVRIADGGGR